VNQEADFFTYAGFRDFLTYAKRYGRIIPLREWQSGGIILRHDVDFGIKFAHRLAQMEVSCEVGGTYFFLMTGPYNTLSALNRDMVRDISAMGFEIGLHFDPIVYNEGELGDAVVEEMRTLESVGVSVQSVSLHRPLHYGSYPMFANCFNAYDPHVFSKEIYFSDSRRDFHGKDPYAFVRQRNGRTLQMLFHPGHFSEDFEYRSMFREQVQHFCEAMDRFWEENQVYEQNFPSGLFNTMVGG
jgi:hypothetical protein